MPAPVKHSLAEAIRRSVVVEATGCWRWTRFIDKDGYGRFTWKREVRQAHRFAYRAFRGPIPDGLTIDHVCRNRACCNPDHLEAVTRAVNTMRAKVARTRCMHGHEFTPLNTYVYKGARQCRECNRIAARRCAERRVLENT